MNNLRELNDVISERILKRVPKNDRKYVESNLVFLMKIL